MTEPIGGRPMPACGPERRSVGAIRRGLRAALLAGGLVLGGAAIAVAASGIELWDATGAKYVGWYIDATTNAAKVYIANALPAGTNLIGATWTAKRYEVTPTVQNASYVSGNNIGSLVAFTLDRTTSGILQSVGLQFIGGATTQINGYCFDANPTGSTFTDKGTFTIAAADEAKRINKVAFQLTPAAYTGDAVTGVSQDNYAKPFNSTATIWCAYVDTGTFTPASPTDMRVNITVIESAQ